MECLNLIVLEDFNTSLDNIKHKAITYDPDRKTFKILKCPKGNTLSVFCLGALQHDLKVKMLLLFLCHNRISL